METTFELDPEQKKIKKIIFPYLKALTYELVKTQPQQLEQFMIDFLSTQGNYTTSGLTKAEKRELELLRVKVKRYRDLERHSVVNSNQNFEVIKEEPINSDESCSEENDDVMDDKEEEIIKNKVINIKKSQEIQNMMRSRSSVSAEVYGFYNKKQKFVPKVIPKNEDQMNRIKGKIISSFIFSSLDKKDLEVVINAMEEKRFKLNENVITQGENGDCLYIVETGSLKCFKTLKPDNTELFLKNYESGDSFGELSLLYNCPRAANVVCSSEECILWSLDRETFNNIVKDAAQKKREKYENFLKNVNILSTIDSYELGQICDSLKEGVFKKDEYIIREGELGDVFYIIEEGKCNATKTLEPGKDDTIINELKEGDYFGERALLRGEPRYANIVVSSDTVKVISLDRRSFNRLLGPIMDILKRNMDKYQIYCANDNENIENNEKNNNNLDTNSNININNNNNDNNNNLDNLNNIITYDKNEDNINNIKINDNDNNPINISNNDDKDNNNIDNENTDNINNNNIDVKPNLNSIITSDTNNNINNNNDNNINNINNNNIDVKPNLNSIITSDTNNINNNGNEIINNNENEDNNPPNSNNNNENNENLDNNPPNLNNNNDNIKNEDNSQNNNIYNENNEDNKNENEIIIQKKEDDKENSIDEEKDNNNNNNNNNEKLPSLMDQLTNNVDVENIENNDKNNNIDDNNIDDNNKNEEKENIVIKEENNIENKNENVNENNENVKENNENVKENNENVNENNESMKYYSTENKIEDNEQKEELPSLAGMLISQNNEETNDNKGKTKTSGIKMELAKKEDDSDYDVL